ncbi:MAG: GTP-binding protein [Eubacteriales bacterium]|nr:GTP-binding protein [Eubacteriales bacterium]
MPQIDLITGFLGSGKTTFIEKYARFLIANDQMVGILENDYGAINIDMALLQDLMGNNCDVEMIVGGDGILSHKRRFMSKLISMAMTGYDRVVVEPSGIYDTDEFFDALAEEPLCRWYSPGSILSIVDADLPEELSRESEYLLAAQTACAGKVVLSRWQDKDPQGKEKKARILAHLNRALERFHCDRRLTEEDLFAKDWENLTGRDFAEILSGGMVPASHVKIPVDRENGYGTLFYYGTHMNEADLRRKVRETLTDPACGNVLRVKGFVRTGENNRLQVNATKREMEIEPTVFANEVLIVTGEDLDRTKIDAIWAPESEIITPGTEPAH